MKDQQKKTEVNDLISLVESDEWKIANSFIREQLTVDLYQRLKSAKRFVPPTEAEVELLMSMELEHWPSSPNVIEYSATEARKFVSFYQSKGWMVGKNKMKDWQAAARGWLARNKPAPKPPSRPRTNGSDDPRLY